MNRFRSHRFRRHQKRLTDVDHRSSLPSISSISSDGSHSSLSSLISSVRDLSINLNRGLLKNDRQSESNTRDKRNPLQNRSLCKTCHSMNSLSECDICPRCRDNQPVTRSDSLPLPPIDQHSTTSEIERSQSVYIENVYHQYERRQTVNNSSDQLKRQCILRLANSHQACTNSLPNSSCVTSQSYLSQLLLQPTFSLETNVIETKQCPISPVVIPPISSLSPERISHYKQQQIELDRVVEELLQNLTNKTHENIKQISKYWSYLKQISLDQFQPKTSHFQLFDYLLQPTSSSNKQFAFYLDQNDEIQAALQILIRVLSIVHGQNSLSSITQLFDSVEKSMLENLRSQSECLLSSYKDELSFIHERIHFYESLLDEKKTFHWVQCIKVDYPVLIEKLSDDFIMKVPQIEHTLLQMLRNMKKHLLSIDVGEK